MFVMAVCICREFSSVAGSPIKALGDDGFLQIYAQHQLQIPPSPPCTKGGTSVLICVDTVFSF
ncbi:hypothetical protein EV682_11042 [Iodobacter fluviatilis]|uniref:Uncharacterized protein n=1 Tax=Iodobacter fluviatilis TaxID=537 RepID=A0A377Q4M5_9NEIS|nr:hypothetical protein EV682_11042 [Iodobacter fluviatilis]STQ89718.1 Uncharacterised protein [Iodobacter fluviatilis]